MIPDPVPPPWEAKKGPACTRLGSRPCLAAGPAAKLTGIETFRAHSCRGKNPDPRDGDFCGSRRRPGPPLGGAATNVSGGGTKYNGGGGSGGAAFLCEAA